MKHKKTDEWRLRTIGRQFDEQFSKAGDKLGQQLRVRLEGGMSLDEYSQRILPVASPERRLLATIVVPPGYASAKEFADDCGFELVTC